MQTNNDLFNFAWSKQIPFLVQGEEALHGLFRIWPSLGIFPWHRLLAWPFWPVAAAYQHDTGCEVTYIRDHFFVDNLELSGISGGAPLAQNLNCWGKWSANTQTTKNDVRLRYAALRAFKCPRLEIFSQILFARDPIWGCSTILALAMGIDLYQILLLLDS